MNKGKKKKKILTALKLLNTSVNSAPLAQDTIVKMD